MLTEKWWRYQERNNMKCLGYELVLEVSYRKRKMFTIAFTNNYFQDKNIERGQIPLYSYLKDFCVENIF